MSHLIVQCEVLNARINHLAGLGAEPNDTEARPMDLFCELVDGHIGGRTNEGLTLVLFSQVVDDGRRSDGFAGARWTLHDREGFLQHLFHGEHLRVVELRQPRSPKAPRQSDSHLRLLDLVAQQPMVNVARNGSLVNGKRLKRDLHAIVRNGLPDKINREAVVQVDRRVATGFELDADFLGCREPHDGPGALPCRVSRIAWVAQQQFVAGDEALLSLWLGKREVGDALLVEAFVPTHGDILLCLLLLHVLVIVGLKLHQGSHDVLVLVGILVQRLHRRRL
mmetsp:Transcript_40007/g.80193  ORF Transcript_40007/g.80193 Transcript_40007/m.80193 type:complete len:280 (-) Transcript_40007:906-1745(-)